MKNLLILTIIIMFLLPTILLADEYEFGIALTPMSFLKSQEDVDMEAAQMQTGQSSILSDYSLGLHAGYSFAWLFYASVDANAMPPWWVAKQTATIDAEGNRVPGDSLPAFVSFFDVGIRPTLGNLIIMAELGLNHFYIYRQEAESEAKLGVNFRVGLGYKMNAFSLDVLGTLIFEDFRTMQGVFEAFSNDEEWAREKIMQSLIPSVAIYLHL